MKKHLKENAIKPTNILISAVALAWFGLTPLAEAVVPAPDGGYPGFNTAEGQNTLFSLTTGIGNTAVGWSSLKSNTDGSFNTAVGAGTLLFNIGDQSAFEGVDNTAVGTVALLFNTTGSHNTAVGTQALFSNTTGYSNTANGYLALRSNTTSARNTAIGSNALRLATGSDNTALGAGAGQDQTSGSGNVYIGVNMSGVAGENDTTYIRNVYDSQASARPVYVNSDNKLGTLLSTGRVKDDIKPMDKASESILALKPVTFRYKKEVERGGAIQFGLIAEEVAEVNPDLVILDAGGKPESVRYEAINAMLLNEFLKEHKKVEEQQVTITELKRDFQMVSAQQQEEIQTLSAQLKEQAAQIQKVSAQIEMRKPATKVALTKP